MTRLRGHRATGALAIAAAIVVAAGLVAAGLQTIQVRTFALRVPDFQQPAAVLDPGQHPCEGPIVSQGAFTGVGLFGSSARGAPSVGVEIRGHSGSLLASGARVMPPGEGERFVRLNRAVVGALPVTVCLSVRHGRFVVFGSSVTAPGVSATETFPGTQFSLVTTRRSSLIGSLGTAFGRASIFRPDWVGAWTFWLLLVAVVLASGLATLAVVGASHEDDAQDRE